MKRLLLALALLLAPASAFAQCNGIFQPNTLCGNPSASPAVPRMVSQTAITGLPGGTNQQIQYNNLSNFAGFTMIGDGRLTPATGTFTLTPSGVTAGSYGGANAIPIITFDAKGRATLAATISPTAVTLTNISGMGLVTPLGYGAACDGVTDDSIPLQRWYDAISNFAAVGWGLPGRTCMFGNNTNFAAKGLMTIHSRSLIYGNNMTLRALTNAAGFGNLGLTWYNGSGSPNQITGSDYTTVRELIIDGNRDGQLTQTQGSGALFYVIGSTHVSLENVQAINSMADGIYFGGDSGLATNTTFWQALNAYVSNNWRNGMSVVGAARGLIQGGDYNNTTNAHFDGPMCGIDMEPNGATTANSSILVQGVRAAGNGKAGMTTSGASGLCVFGANTTNILIEGAAPIGNFHYGIHTYTPIGFNELRVHGTLASGNLSGTYLNATDFLNPSMNFGAANSCGVGFKCVGIPN